MKDLVALVFLFAVIAVALFAGISAIGTIYSVNAGGCAYNASGSLVNCSLTNAQYQQQNASATAAAQTFTTLTSVEWIVIAAIVLSSCLLLLGLLRRR